MEKAKEAVIGGIIGITARGVGYVTVIGFDDIIHNHAYIFQRLSFEPSWREF